jgi:peptidoglycan hydrolase-like protein with peptidoglycan-binding domain
MLRRAMTTELVVGALIIAITAIMVVSPPATAQDEVGGAGQSSSADEVLVTTTTVAGSTPLLPPVVVVQVTTPQPVTCTVSASLQVGATGDAVLCLQQALAVVGLYQGTPTGTFDEATDAAVKAFQTANALLADGIVGPVTGQKLGIWAGE